MMKREGPDDLHIPTIYNGFPDELEPGDRIWIHDGPPVVPCFHGEPGRARGDFATVIAVHGSKRVSEEFDYEIFHVFVQPSEGFPIVLRMRDDVAVPTLPGGETQRNEAAAAVEQLAAERLAVVPDVDPMQAQIDGLRMTTKSQQETTGHLTRRLATFSKDLNSLASRLGPIEQASLRKDADRTNKAFATDYANERRDKRLVELDKALDGLLVRMEAVEQKTDGL
jgi:hypothetical protein